MKGTKESLLEQLSQGEKKLQQQKHQAQRLENRKQYLEKGERTKRNHRLITRGAAVESVLPQIKPLTEVGFYTLMEDIAELDAVQTAVSKAVQRHMDTMGGDA